MIEVIGLNKKFKKVCALENLQVQFEKGQVVSLIGPNGSGKTTFIKCILGLVKPDSGDILVNGKSILNSYLYRSNIGYMPQIGRFPDHMKVYQIFDLLKNVRHNYNSDIDEELIHSYKLEDLFHKPMRTLSGGTRQKVSAAISFLFNPEIYILDEPTAGLDPLSSEILKEKIYSEKQKNKLVLITSHILSDLDDLTTDVLYLQEGRIQFSSSLIELRKQTGEQKFEKAIAKLMKLKLSNSGC
ncbi:MAG: ABC transporter ATP-binding protein [Saprospiraceae bacterium]